MKTQYIKGHLQSLGLKFLVVFAIILSLTACSKDEDNDKAITSTSLIDKITMGIWYLEEQKILYADGQTGNVITNSCARKTSYEFSKDKTLVVGLADNGSGACEYTWLSYVFKLHSDTDKITLIQTPGGTPREYIILELTLDKLVLQIPTNSGKDKLNITFDRTEG